MKSIVMLSVIVSLAWAVGGGVARAVDEPRGHADGRSCQRVWMGFVSPSVCRGKREFVPVPLQHRHRAGDDLRRSQGADGEQMATTLHFMQPAELLHQAMGELIADINSEQGADPAKTFSLVVANALWAKNGMALNPNYQKLVGDRYAAVLRQVDFAGGGAAWNRRGKRSTTGLAKKTNDKIKDLLAKGSVDAGTRLVLTNAIYFKSVWQNPFDKKGTRDDAFHTGAGDVTVSMMHQKHLFGYTEGDGVQVLGLPYQNDLLTMVVVLPQKAEQLPDVEKRLDAKKLDQWVRAMHQQEVVVSLPKFTFTSSFSLGKTLKDMGMTDAFSGQADFSGMLAADHASAGLSIADVIHKAFIDVNEEQTEAAAATGVIMRLTAVRQDKPVVEFNADHPFVFMIRDNGSGAILFVGRVSNPKA